jgi:hypothetical protein
MSYYYNHSNIFNLQPRIRGFDGKDGPTGPTGPIGPTGSSGSTGLNGSTSILQGPTTIQNSNQNGITGQITFDDNFLYISIDNNNWRKIEYFSTGYVQIGETFTGGTSFINFGKALQLSGNGSIIAIGTPNYDIENNGNTLYNIGKVNLYKYNEQSNAWNNYGQTISGETTNDRFGGNIALSYDANILLISSPYFNNNTGHVKIYEYNNNGEYLPKGSNSSLIGQNTNNYFGSSVSISDDGNIIAIASNGINQVKIYKWNNNTNTWEQLANTINSSSGTPLQIGNSIALSGNGRIIAIGTPNSGLNGIVQVYELNNDDTAWIQLGSNINGSQNYTNAGYNVSMSNDNFIVSFSENGADIPPGQPGNPSTYDRGLVRVVKYNQTTNTWEDSTNIGNSIFAGVNANDGNNGLTTQISADGNMFIAGWPGADTSNGNNSGRVRIYKLLDNVNWTLLLEYIGSSTGNELGIVSISKDATTFAISEANYNNAEGRVLIYKKNYTF